MNNFKTNFYLQKVKKEKEYTFISISVAWNNKRVRTTLKIQIEERLWDSKKQRAKASSKNPHQINEKLDEIRSVLKKQYEEIEAAFKRPPTEKEVKLILEAVINNKEVKTRRPNTPKKVKPFIDYFQDFINDTESGARLSNDGKKIGASTLTGYYTTKNHLEEFLKTTKAGITFDDIDDSFFSSLIKYLTTKKLSNNSQGRFVKIIKTFMHYTSDKGLHTNRKFVKSLKIFNEETQQFALNRFELDLLQNLSGLTPKLQRLQDLFLVQIYTGLRFSDLFNLKPENVNLPERKITLYTVKTQKPISIPLAPRLQMILEKYNCSLPKISSQKFNEGIKELCKLAGINEMMPSTYFIGSERIDELRPKYEVISSHTARRTFITLSLKKGVLPEMVMKVSGHTSRKSFQKYVRITDEEALDEVRKAWE